jgi:ATP-dependent RNA helicase RhlE
VTTFNDLGLAPQLLKTLAQQGFETPTPIQRDAIPLVLSNHDIMGLAQTGTGKTAAFCLPLINKLLDEKTRPSACSTRALILAPTRELANQIVDSLKLFVLGTPIRVAGVVGGASLHRQISKLQKGVDILVATPGRLIDLVERKALYLDRATYLVLDEADQMLDMGFIHALRDIAKMVASPRQTLLFSATMSKQMAELSKAFLSDPVRVEASTPGLAADKIRQSVHIVDGRDKLDILKRCLSEDENHLSLVFVRTKHGAEKMLKNLQAANIDADSIHGNKSQGQRERAIRAFRQGKVRVLVATDVAARGIDVPGVTHVYNHDLPEVPENYVHRIGRTARAGAEGEAIALCCAAELPLLRAVERVMKAEIPVASCVLSDEELRSSERGSKSGNQRNRRRRGSSQSNSQQNGDRPKRSDKRQSFAKDVDASSRPARAKKPHRKGQSQGQKQVVNKSGAQYKGRQNKKPARRPNRDAA